MEALTRYALAGVAALTALTLTAPAQPQASNQYELLGAVAPGKTGSEVRLLWTVTQGWLPAGGFHVYRSAEGQAPQKLTTAPLKLNLERLSPETAGIINGNPNGIAGKPLFSGSLTGRGSSKSAFQSFKNELTRLKGVPGISGEQLATRAAQAPEVRAFRAQLDPGKRPEKGQAPSDADKTAGARLQVLLTGLSSYPAALQLGLAFVDRTPPPGRSTYRYSLRAVDAAGQELPGEAASVLVVLGAPGAERPPAPTDLEGVQLNQHTVALHWEPLSQAEEQGVVGASYSVYRNEQKLNREPIRIAFQATKTGSAVPALTSFHDEKAPLGNVVYTVKLTDAFGRESVAATAAVTVADLRTPAAVPQAVVVASRTQPGAVRVYWASAPAAQGDIPGTDAAYDIYRADRSQNESLLTGSAPITGDPVGSIRTVGGNSVVSETLADLTLGNVVALHPALRTLLQQANLRVEDYKAETMDRFVGHIPAGLRITLGQQLGGLLCYTDTTVTPDSDYRYRVSACYPASRDRHTGGGQAGAVAVPTTAVPAAPAGLSAQFTRGAGKFGYLETAGSAPTLRRSGLEGVVLEQPRRIKAPTVTGVSIKQTVGQTTIRTTAPKAPSMSIAGTVQLTWQPTAFTSPVHYRVYRAAATGLFPTVGSAAAGQPPVPQVRVGKLGVPQKSTVKEVARQRLSLTVKYFDNYPNVPRDRFVLLTETDKTSYTDTLPVSQRMHYHYRIVPVSRWGVEGPETPVQDTAIPATLAPSLPILLRTLVDEAVAEGHVRLEFQPNPLSEHVSKYLIFRKPLSEAIRSVQRDRAAIRVASRQLTGVPRVPAPAAPSQVRNLNVTEIKANGAAILKRLLDPDGYRFVGELPASPSDTAALTYTDSAGDPRVPFAYRIVALNTDQLGSPPSAPLDATALKVRCETPASLTTTLNTGGDAPQVQVAWQPSPKETPARYVLERAAEKLTPAPTTGNRIQQLKQSARLPSLTYVTLATLDANTRQLADTTVRSGRRYTYRLRAVDGDGLFSEPLVRTVTVPALAAATFADPPPAPMPTPEKNPAPPVEPAGAVLPPSKKALFGKWYYYDSEKRWAYTITRAEYTTVSFVWGPRDQSFLAYPAPQEKLIRLTLQVKNVSNDAAEFGYQSLVGHGISADGNLGPDFMRFKRLDNGNQAQMTMPPGQSATVQTYLNVAAQGAARALTVGESVFPLGAENPVAPLPAFLSKDGVTVGEEVPATRNQAYPGARYEAAVVGLTRSGAAFGDQTLEDGKEFVLVTVRLKNLALDESPIEYQTFTLTLYDSDDDKYTADRPYKENKPEQVTAPVAPAGTDGDTRVVRYLFTVPKGANLKKLLLRESDARTYVYPESQLK